MATAPIPLTNVGNGYTIVTQVIPSSTAPATAEQNSSQTLSPLRKFLKGEPKALGTVQIMIGVLTILFGVVMAVYPLTISVFSGVSFWASMLHISAGSLAVSASNKLHSCVVKAALVLNILSAIAAGIAIIMLCLDLGIGSIVRRCEFSANGFTCNHNPLAVVYAQGISGVLLVFSVLQFVISIVLSSFGCKATCSYEPTLNIITMVPKSETSVPVANPTPAHDAHPGVSSLNATTISRPPAYSEKVHPYN